MKISRWSRLVIVLSLLPLAPLGLRADLYVSPDGRDDNPGTAERPFRTLERARDAVRSMDQNLTADLTIYLADGVYRLAQPLELDPRDSGTNGHNVIYAAEPGRHPVISGGVRVTGWKQIDATRNLWAAPAPEALENTRQLFVDGVRALRARGALPAKLTQTATGYVADTAVMAGWRNPGDMEIVYQGGLGAWTEPRCPVAGIDGRTITMAEPCWDNCTKRAMLVTARYRTPANLVGPASLTKEPSYLENAFELLGTPGQWYFDRPTRTIYYVPRSGEDPAHADVEAALLQQLVVGRGTPDQPIHNLVFAGLQFAYATWLFPSSGEGFSEIQANYTVTGPTGYATQGLGSVVPGGTSPYGAWTKIPGNLSFSYDRQIQFQGDAFTHLGAAGLDLGNGSQADTVVGCVFTDISGNGVELGGVDLPEGAGGQITSDNQILNNHFYDIAAEYHGGVAICAGYVRRTLVKHNQIDHIPYSAISFGWGGWLNKISRPGVANNSEDNVVTENLIFDHMLLLNDGGGVYTQGLTGPSLAEGEKVTKNVIYDQLGSGNGVYTDDGSCNITIEHNVILHTQYGSWSGQHKNYYNGGNGSSFNRLFIADNYWQQGNPDSPADDVTLANNRLITALADAPADLLRNAGLQPKFQGILRQSFAPPRAPEAPSRVDTLVGDGVAYVLWNPPSCEGGATVESYTVTDSQGDRQTISAGDLQTQGYVAMTGLADGAEYAFTVTATNRNGTSVPSLPSATIVPEHRSVVAPAAPHIVVAYARNGMVSIHFQKPDSDGGSPIIGYLLTVNPGDRRIPLTGRPVLTPGKHKIFSTVGGLQSGQTYTLGVAALTAAGEGAVATTPPFTVSE